MESYLPEVLENLDEFWPDRPETFVVNDGSYSGPNVLRFEGVDFASLLKSALQELRKKSPNTKYIFLMLEDLCPLWGVDQSLLQQLITFARKMDAKYIGFSWRNRNNVPWHDGRWDVSNALYSGDTQIVQIPKYYRCYNALNASVWEYSHLEAVVETKNERQATTPWEFERPLGPDQPQHYLVDNAWPTVRHGFFHKGQHNHMVAKRPMPDSPLRARLLKEYHA